MPSLNLTIATNGNVAADSFQLSAEQRAYIQTTYINTGKMTEEKSVAGPSVGQITSARLTFNFSSQEAMQEYLADPQIQEIKDASDAFYASRNITPQRSANFN